MDTPDNLVERRLGQLRTDLARLRQDQNPRVMIGMPIMGGMADSEFWLSCQQLFHALTLSGIEAVPEVLYQESLISRARSRIAAQFLTGDFTHLLFIDSDIEFHPLSAVRLFLHDLPLVVGAYPKKSLPVSYVVNASGKGHGGEVPVRETPIGKVVEVKEAGTGFMLIKREVFEAIIEHHGGPGDDNPLAIAGSNAGGFDGFPKEYLDALESNYYAFFDTSLAPRKKGPRQRYLSEDYYFCQLAAECGYPTYLDPAIRLNHIGRFVYQGDISKLFAAVGMDSEAAAKADF